MMPATAEEPAALAYRRRPTVQPCNPIHATAGMQDVISRARLKLFSRTSDREGGCGGFEKPLPPEIPLGAQTVRFKQAPPKSGEPMEQRVYLSRRLER
jgi:hypothetical protein